MADKVTFREMIAYRPLVFAWAWEMLCVLGAVGVMLTSESVPATMGLIFAGVLPFGVVLLMFLRARKSGELGPKPKGIVE